MIRIRANRRGRIALLPAAMLALASAAFAQTNWSIEGSVPTYGEFNAPACATLPPPPYAINLAPIPLPGCPTLRSQQSKQSTERNMVRPWMLHGSAL